MKSKHILILLLSFGFLMSQCNKKSQPTIDDEIITTYLTKNSLTATKTSTGLYYMITKSTTDVQAQAGNVASVFYTGKFMDDRVFDGNTSSTSTFSFTIGRGQVIQGWDEGLPLMKKGEKARLFIPSHLAYGNLGSGPIGPNTVIQFEIELVTLK